MAGREADPGVRRVDGVVAADVVDGGGARVEDRTLGVVVGLRQRFGRGALAFTGSLETGLQLFELPYVLSAEINEGQGPNNAGLTIVMYLYNLGFGLGDIGYASAVGWALVVLIFSVSLMQLKITRATAEDDR